MDTLNPVDEIINKSNQEVDSTKYSMPQNLADAYRKESQARLLIVFIILGAIFAALFFAYNNHKSLPVETNTTCWLQEADSFRETSCTNTKVVFKTETTVVDEDSCPPSSTYAVKQENNVICLTDI